MTNRPPARRAKARHAGWIEELVEPPGKALGSLDTRHWSERMATMLCMQASDTGASLIEEREVRSRTGPEADPGA